MEIINKDILRRWLNGSCTDEEVILIKNYLQQKGAEAFTQQLDEDWENAQGAMGTPDTERLLANIRSTIHSHSLPENKTPVIRFHKWKRVAVAAAILAIVLTGAWSWFSQSHNTRTDIAAQTWLTIQNTQHHKINISLPDQSKVWLAAGATLKYVNDFGKAGREVQLTGEAFFEITKDSLHPFTVQAGKVNTRVLGTHFNVEAYETEAFTRISLVEGKVTATYTGARNQAEAVTLLPGNRLCYNRLTETGKMEQMSLNEQDFTGAAIVLQDISVSTALNRIGMHYGKKIQLQDSLQDKQRFSAIVPGNDLKAALDNLAFVYQLQYHMEQDIIQVYKN